MTVTTIEPVRKQVTVDATPERAFEVFTAGIARWWNPGFTIGAEPFETVVLEPREGGRWYERAANGAECDWGRVLVWTPPHRLVLAWQIDAQWRYDADVHTEVEVTFTPTGDGGTRVDLVHRGLDALGAAAADSRATFDSPGGWAGLLDRFADALSP